MLKNLFVILLMSCLFFSCRSFSDMMNVGSNVKKLELGMSKRDVVSIMGKSYLSLGAIQTPEGNVEVIGYPTADDNLYRLHILEGKLVQWEYERIKPHRDHHRNN